MYKIKKRTKVQRQRSKRIAQFNPGLTFSDATTYVFSNAKRTAGVAAGSLLLVSMVAPNIAQALPRGGTVVGGSATISVPNAATMNINQSSNKAIINWNGFDINTNELVKFVQPGTSAVILNRVVGADPSSILGQMQANGRVFIVNPNGIFFGQSAVVDVAGLIATTLNIKDTDFMAGNYTFTQDQNAALAAIVNKGKIYINDKGFAVFVAPLVSNEG
ncbi:MAG: filamentous hemagglutinin N-terminal domain-containing protein, partial [Nitrospirota bacterium]|nr:filamentous hemagglutinin N-terminal domain-containing protein [Nitrospirota bacterium]